MRPQPQKLVSKANLRIAVVAQQLQTLLNSTTRNTGFNMPLFPVADAARRAGVERTTLYRKLKKGQISGQSDASGNKYIEASELLRVYPDADVSESFATMDQQLQERGIQQRATVNDNRLLQREIEVRDEKIRALEQERERERRDAQTTIDDLRLRLDQEAEERRKLTLILTDQRPQTLVPVAEQQPKVKQRPLARPWLIALLIAVATLGGVVFFLKDYVW